MWTKLFWSFLFLNFLRHKVTCTKLEDVLKQHDCTCDEIRYENVGLRLSCPNLTDTLELRQKDSEFVINCDDYYMLDEGDQHCSNLTNFVHEKSPSALLIKSCTFHEPGFQEIVFEITKILKYIDTIIISNTKVQDIPSNLLHPFQHLKHFELKNIQTFNKVEIEPSFFNQNPKLQTIILSNTQLQSVPDKLFQSLTKLLALDLSQNYIKTLPKDIFHSNTQLEFLYLSNNSLDILPEGVFQHLAELLLIDLSGNNLIELPQNLFQKNVQLNKLLMDKDNCSNATNLRRVFPQNFLQNNHKLQIFSYSVYEYSCKEIFFSQNIFSNETSQLKNLSITHTPLGWNGILTLLPTKHHIQNLDLSHNQISKLNPETFPGDLKYLNLEGNTFDCNDCTTLNFLSNLTIQNETELSGQLFCKDFRQSSEQRYNIESGYQHFCQLQIYPFILAVVIFVFVLILLVIFTSKRVQMSLYNCSITSKLFLSEKDVGEKKFDLFVSYAEEDSGIHQKFILNLMESSK